jgi:transcriptional regulator with XRE-family HTH domain
MNKESGYNMKQFKTIILGYIQDHGDGNVCVFGDLAGISSASLYHWLAGKTSPKLDKLITLAKFISEQTGETYQDIITEIILSLPESINIIQGTHQ